MKTEILVALLMVMGICANPSTLLGDPWGNRDRDVGDGETDVHVEGHKKGHDGEITVHVEGHKEGHKRVYRETEAEETKVPADTEVSTAGHEKGEEKGHGGDTEALIAGHEKGPGGDTEALKAGHEKGHQKGHEKGHGGDTEAHHDVKTRTAGHEKGQAKGQGGDTEALIAGHEKGPGGDTEALKAGHEKGHEKGHEMGHGGDTEAHHDVKTRTAGHEKGQAKGQGGDTEARHDVGARARHMKQVYAWSEMDYVFPDEKTRDHAIVDETFIPGNSFPMGFDVDPVSGRVFVTMPRNMPGNPAALATVSKKKGFGEEHMLTPYPSWAWHKQGDCEGITSVYRIHIDECRRLWVLDTGIILPENRRICPPQILIFDLSNDQIIKRYQFPDDVLKSESKVVNIVVDVRDTARKCKDTYAYIADVRGFGLIVYNYAKDVSWRVVSNEVYPYPPWGLFNIHGSQFDLMDGIVGLALSPKQRNRDRTLYFHSLASNVESWVDTSLLRNKTNFPKEMNLVPRKFYTSPGKRSGQAAGEAFDEDGVLFFSVLPDMTIDCWNSKKEYVANNLVTVDRDEEAFQFITTMKVIKTQQGVAELWVLSNRVQRIMVGTLDSNDVNYRIMKAPVDQLVKGTSCAVPRKPQAAVPVRPPSGGTRPSKPSAGASRPTVKPGGSYQG